MSDSIELTQFEELIYNTFHKTHKQQNNQPFKYRKNFENLDNYKKGLLKKLSLFFNKFKHIHVDTFFLAPYKIYKDETYFDLQYYTTLKAVKAYTLYQKQQAILDPDIQEQLINIQNSLIFLNKYCLENKINLSNYLYTREGNQPAFLIHLKEHKINFYTLFGLANFCSVFKQQDKDVVKFVIGEELYDYIDVMKVKFFGSQKALQLVSKGLIKIKENIEKS